MNMGFRPIEQKYMLGIFAPSIHRIDIHSMGTTVSFLSSFSGSFILIFLLVCGGPISRAQSFGSYDEMLTAFKNQVPDSNGTYEVDGLMIEHGPVTIMLVSGTVHLGSPVGGRPVSAVFVGKGSAIFTPTLPVEKINLQRFYPNDVYNEEFTSAFFLFVDDDMAAQFKSGTHKPTERPESDVHGIMAAGVEAYVSTDGKQVEPTLARAILNNRRGDRGFICQTYSKEGQYQAIIGADPYDTEPYTLTIGERGTLGWNWTSVNQCPPPEGVAAVDSNSVSAGDMIYVGQHTIVCSIDRSLAMKTTDRMDVTITTDSAEWISLSLNYRLTVDSVREHGGAMLTTHRPDKSGLLWIKLPRTMRRGERTAFVITYHGEVIERQGDITFLKTSIDWYPYHGYKQLSFFDLVFEHDRRYILVSIGDKASEEKQDDIVRSRWLLGRKMRNASFNIGLFREKMIEGDGYPDVQLNYYTKDQVDVVETDVKQALNFFTKLFGPLPINRLYATELPAFHGEAFPGMLHLSTLAFYKVEDARTDDFFGEQFTSHEVAHQWWGIAVDFRSYRDQWLSEGFAMYSCLLYSQLAASEGDKFFRLLEEYSKSIRNNGKNMFGTFRKPPSISLGGRVSSGGSGGEYNTFIYYKGAWVVHMLRNMMLDLTTMKEDAFMAMFKDFYATHKLRSATTETFRQTVEKHVGQDMSWFFDQWVHGNDIPTYTFAWKHEKQADGTYKITCRVRQDDVPETFRMYIPIRIVTEDKKVYRMRLHMTGKEAVIDLPAIAGEPDDIVFNDLTSVLCTVKTEKF